MLLRADRAATRSSLFIHPVAKKVALTKRIVWFTGPKAAPSFNHAWYVWDHKHCGPPTLAYAPYNSQLGRRVLVCNHQYIGTRPRPIQPLAYRLRSC
jgi:hypothetical protein